MRYTNRQDAGERLADTLWPLFKDDDVVVLALPRGGVVLGAEVAKALSAPLGLVLVRKIGHPFAPEYAIGAVAEDEQPVYNENEVASVDKLWLERAEEAARALIAMRRELYYGNNNDGIVPPDIEGKTVILVDDGIATGMTMIAAVRAVRSKHPKRVVVAVPVAAQESIVELEVLVDEIVVLDDPEAFLGAIGAHYQDFPPVDDHEVKAILKEATNEL